MRLTDSYNKVAEVSFNNVFMTLLILYFQIEFFFYVCYNNLIFFTKINQIFKVNQLNSNLMLMGGNDHLFLLIILLTFFSLKGFTVNLLGMLIILILYLLKLSRIVNFLSNSQISNTSLHIVFVTLAIFFYFLFFIKSFLTFFFFVELYGVIYYFFFLTNYSLTSQTILKYKNGILLLLWNNFLTTFFLGLACFYICKNYGTTDFFELFLLTNSTPYIYVFLCGIFWKLGLPLFHFFKIEVYKFLLKENVFMFSILTTLVNIVILYTCLAQPLILNTVYLSNFFLFILIFTIIVVVTNLKLSNILQFFAISSVLTLGTVLSLFLI